MERHSRRQAEERVCVVCVGADTASPDPPPHLRASFLTKDRIFRPPPPLHVHRYMHVWASAHACCSCGTLPLPLPSLPLPSLPLPPSLSLSLSLAHRQSAARPTSTSFYVLKVFPCLHVKEQRNKGRKSRDAQCCNIQRKGNSPTRSPAYSHRHSTALHHRR